MAFNFNGNVPKNIIYNGYNVAKLVYNNVVVWVQKFLSTVRGTNSITLEKAVEGTPEEVKAFGKCEQRKLPKGYTELEYLESTGTQYIDTGIVADGNTSAEIDYQMKSDSSTSAIFGYRLTTGVDDYLMSWSNITDKKLYYSYGTGNTGAGTGTTSDFNRHIRKMTPTGGYYDGLLVASWSSQTFTTSGNSSLFGRTGGTSKASAIVYSCKIWSGNTLVRDLVPCIRKSDNKPGMYDTVTNTFFTNAGTGEFIAGPEIVPTPDNPIPIWCNNGELKVKDSELPVGYKRVKDLIYDGNSYFITNYKLKGSDTLRFKFNAPQGSVNVMGCYNGADANNNFSYYLNTGSGGSYARYGSELYRPKAQSLNTDYNVIFSPTGITGLDDNVSWQAQTFTSDAYFYIGWLDNATSSALIGTIKGNVEIDNTAKFIPCERLSDNALGYYDTYSNTFFENQGTGTLSTSGYDYTYTPEIYTDGTAETIEITGKNLFDTAGQTLDKYYNTSGVEQDSVYDEYSFAHTDFLKVKPNTTYTFSFKVAYSKSSRLNHRIIGWTSSKSYVKEEANIVIQPYTEAGTLLYSTFTTSATTEYVTINYIYSPLEAELQLEEGSTVTTYEPYFNGGTATAENLLSVSTYEDVQEVISGSVTKKVGIKVLDGSEEWAQYSANNKVYTFSDPTTMSHPQNAGCLCSHFVTSSIVPRASDNTNKLFLHPITTRVYICLPDIVGDVSAFKQWLADQYNAGTPVIIVYPLETPTTETATAQPLTLQKGTNIIEVTEASLYDLDIEATYYRTT